MDGKKILVIAAVLATIVCFSVSAQPPADPPGGPPPHRPGLGIARADTNGDGKITLEELQAIWPGVDEEIFARLDRNGDGVLSGEDRRGKGMQGPEGERGAKGPKGHKGPREGKGMGPGPMMGPPPACAEGGPQMPPPPPGGPQGRPEAPRMRLLEKLREADANGDKEVTFEELSAVAPHIDREKFQRLDRNGDGVISAADMPAGPRAGQGFGPNAGQGPQGIGPNQERGERLRQLFREADTDGDGKLTFEELSAKFPKMDKERFERFDRNKDGFLSREDRQGPPPAPREP